MVRSILLAGLLTLVGCAVPPSTPPAAPAPVAVTQPTPTCSGKQECEAIWIRAYEQLQNVTGMRIQTATDNVIQTFGPIRGDQLGGMATKYPVGGDKYEIRVRFSCRYSGPHCEGVKASATNAFNATVPPLR